MGFNLHQKLQNHKFIRWLGKFQRSTSCPVEKQRKVRGTKVDVDFFVSKAEKNLNRAELQNRRRRSNR